VPRLGLDPGALQQELDRNALALRARAPGLVSHARNLAKSRSVCALQYAREIVTAFLLQLGDAHAFPKEECF